jgi:hypothetical protein
MSIYRKKSAVINSQVRIRNELSQVFVPTNNNNNNLGISINTTVPVNSTNTIATTNVIGNMSKQYYISLISSTTGYQTINTSTNLLYNTDTDNLQLNNLSTINPPSCSATPVNSNDLINKAYLNSFVGDYTQGWIYDDWITGDASGSLNWNVDRPANASIIASDASGHIGILRLNASSNGNVSGITLYFIIGNVFNYSNIKSVKFLVKPFSDLHSGNEFVYIGLSNGYNALTNDSVGFYKNQGSGWFYVMNRAIINTNVYYTLPVDIQKKWILFEIEITNNIPIFYITIENGSRQVACAPGTTITTTTLVSPVIRQTSNSIDIDYIDLKYSGITRR